MAEPLTKVENGITYVRQYNAQTGKYSYVPLKTAQTAYQAQVAAQQNQPNAIEKLLVALSGAPKAATAAAQNVAANINNAYVQPAINYPANYVSNTVNAATPQNKAATTVTGGGTGGTGGTGGAGVNYNKQVTDYINQLLSQQGAGGQILTDVEKKLLEQYKASSLNPEDYFNKAKEELKPYYERLLKEANYDVDLAVSRMEQDYTMGLRRAREDAGTSLKGLMATGDIENTQALADLNQRGLLGTPTGIQASSMTATAPDTGGALSTQPRMTYQGLGGSRLALLQQSQQARQEAINRALSRGEETADLSRTRSMEDYNTTRQRTTATLEQQQKEQAQQLGTSKYNQALNLIAVKRGEIMSPYT